MGSARGYVNSLPVTDLNFVLEVALSGQDKADNNWQWWLGRVSFIDRILSNFSHDFLISQCLVRPRSGPSPNSEACSDEDDPSFGSGMTSRSDSISSSAAISTTSENMYGNEAEQPSLELNVTLDQYHVHEQQDQSESIFLSPNPRSISATNPTREESSLAMPVAAEGNLLMQLWFFAARATHIPLRKLGRVARRVIIRISKILRDDPSSLEVVHVVVSRCHRTVTEGLLDRVLQARENPAQVSPTSLGAGDKGVWSSGGGLTAGRKLDIEQKKRKRRSGSKAGKSPLPSSPPRPAAITGPEISSATSSKTASWNSFEASPLPLSKGAISSNGDTATFLSLTPSKQQSRQNASLPLSSVDNAAGVFPRISDSEMDSKDGGARTLSPNEREQRRKGSRQKNRGLWKGGPSDDFVASDESFQSALSEFDLDETLLEGAEAEGDGSSGSHDSKRSAGHLIHSVNSASSSSGGSVGRGQEVWSAGAASESTAKYGIKR